jgi:hypothetical protein
MIRACGEYLFLWKSTFIFSMLYLDRLETGRDREGVKVGQAVAGIEPQLLGRKMVNLIGISLIFYSLNHTATL